MYCLVSYSGHFHFLMGVLPLFGGYTECNLGLADKTNVKKYLISHNTPFKTCMNNQKLLADHKTPFCLIINQFVKRL